MVVILPFCARDKAAAEKLAEWIKELGGVSEHDCLLAVHKDTDSKSVLEPLTEAFARVAEFAITDEMIVEREMHTYAANLMWKRVANHVADMNEPAPWLWLEPDATPLTAQWLDRLAAAYGECGKPFLHDLVTTATAQSNSGCGIYPPRVRDYTDRLWQLTNVSWDVLLFPDFQPHTAYTRLIQDAGFIIEGVMPTFPDHNSLSFIRPEAVLFHRCKDGTLIDRLHEQLLQKLRIGVISNETHNAWVNEMILVGAGNPNPLAIQPTPESDMLPLRNPEPEPARKLIKSIHVYTIEDTIVYFEDGTKQAVKASRVCVPAGNILPLVQNGKAKKNPKRTAQEQAKINERMAKARAGRGKKLTGVA